MSIAFKKYVNIISGVGGGAGVRQRDLIGRFISSNKLISPDAVLEFTSADNVGLYFGTTSEEYLRAVDYFGYISPNISTPQKISFSRWSEAGNGSAVIGNNDAKVLANLQAVNAGAFDLVLGGSTVLHVTALDLSAAASMAAVAAALQTKIAALVVGATVTYATDGPNRFTVQLPTTSLGTIEIRSVSVGAQDAAFKLGLTVAANAINISGVGAQLALDAFIASQAVSDNFGSFTYLDTLDLSEITAIAAQNDTYNVRFMFLVGVLQADYVAWFTALKGYSGIGLTLINPTLYPNQFPEQFPMAIMAATNYDKRNAVTNYMFRQGQNMAALVATDVLSDALDVNRINYYGQTATAGQLLTFYQRGKLMGLATDPVDMNVYANEMWLKDYAGAQIMGLQLGVSRVPANDTGVAMILGTLQPVIDQALFNGTISVGKDLTSQQKIFIEQQTGDDTAWREVESVGYILSCVISSEIMPDSSTEYTADYTLIYSKDDAIRKVNGTHQLI